MMIKAIIVDDDLSAIRSKKGEVDKFCKDIEIIDNFTDPIEAISGINYLKPECIFLDIEMPEKGEFQLLSSNFFSDKVYYLGLCCSKLFPNRKMQLYFYQLVTFISQHRNLQIYFLKVHRWLPDR